MSISCPNPNPKRIYIPIDIKINILLRLPVKSLLRFRCVTKLWSSIITSQYFQNKHITTITASSAPPSLLITFLAPLGTTYKNLLTLVSYPNPKTSLYSSSSRGIDMKLLKVEDRKVYNSVRGLICIGSRFEVQIYNPSTSQQYIFPQISIAGLFCKSTVYYFGYDPVEDQYKVLAINDMRMQLYHSVVVLGRDGVWREVPWFGYLHHAQTSGLCINGTLYYGAIRTYNKFSIVVSFDVRLETFNIIKGPVFEKLNNEFKSDFTDKTLINFWGKIAVVEKPRSGSFRMWVLKDAKKEEWFMNIYRLPESAACLDLDVMTYFYAGEICLVSKKLSDPFCLFFYNLKMERIRNVTIEGLPISVLKEFSYLTMTVSDHYDSFMSILT